MLNRNSDSQQVLEGSEAVEKEYEGLDRDKEIESKLESNGSHPKSKSSVYVPSNDDTGSVPGAEPIAVADMGDSVNQDKLIKGISDDFKVTEDAGKEDMFVDAPDELDNRLQDELERLRTLLEKTVAEKEVLARDNKEERESFTKELANLHHQLKALTDHRSFPDKNEIELVDRLHKEELRDKEEMARIAETPLHMLINECSESIKSALEERLQTEGTLRELHAILYMKDQEIEDLHAKVTEYSISCDVVDSYLTSTQNIWSQSIELSSRLQFEKDQHVDTVLNRMLASIATVVSHEELLDDSVTGKISHVEKSASQLISNYTMFLSEIDQLRQCLNEAQLGVRVQEEFGTVFVAARDELLELRRKEADFAEKLSHLEDENKKLIEQLDKEKGMVEMANAELGKTKIDLEQEKSKCANAREKLSMAVTKGKALIQQRDLLRQSLAEKTSELDKCLVELQEKSSALDAAELSKEGLVKSENMVASLQEALSQRNTTLEKFEEILSQIPEELHSVDMAERIRWLLDERNELQSAVELSKEELAKSENLVASLQEALSEELAKSENLVASLQEALSERNMTLEKFEEILSQIPEELHSVDMAERIRWLLDERNGLKGAVELSKEELIKRENLAASLKEEISQMNMILKKSEEILFQTGIPDRLHSVDMIEKIELLVDERNALKGVSLEFHKLRDALSLIHLPETVLSSDLVSQVIWLGESFYRAKDEIIKLHDDIARTREAANNEIDRLTALFLAETQEKDYLQMELDDLTCKYEGISEKEHQFSLEKDQIVSMLLEASGITLDNQEWVYLPFTDLTMLMERCLGKMKEQSNPSFGSPRVEEEKFETILTLLYLRDQELMLCMKILEEEMLERSEINNLSNELGVASQALLTLKEEKDSLQKDFDRSEEKYAMLREKLSMAVKKGKGLVQERENLRSHLDEKNKEIEKLKLDLQQQESLLGEYRDQINRLSTDVERVPKLEADLVALQDQRDQLEKFLVESNNMLQRVMESIDSIVLPTDLGFHEPMEKVKWLVGYCSECQESKTHAEQELGKVKEEVSSLALNLSEANITINSQSDALLVAENNFSQLVEEKRELELLKTDVEQALQKAMDEARSQSDRLNEACATRKSLEDAISAAEKNTYVLISEKECAEAGRTSTEEKLEKEKEKVAIQTKELAEAYKTIKTLEDMLSQAEANVALLTEENNNAQVSTTNLENELKKLKDEIGSQVGNLDDAHATIKSLEDALLNAENASSELVSEKKIAEEELLLLNSKLNTCMEQLSGTHGSLESRLVELIGQFNDLRVLMKDETLLSLFRKSFEKNFQRLKDMDIILKTIRDHYIETVSEAQQNHLVIEEESYVTKLFSDGPNNVLNIEIDDGEVITKGDDDVSSHCRKTVEALNLRNKFLADKFEGFSSFMDEFTAALLRKLLSTRDDVIIFFENMESLKHKVKDMEMQKQSQENTIALLENDIATLLSACTNATQKLQYEVENKLLELSSVPDLENLDHGLLVEVGEVGFDATGKDQQGFDGSKYVETAEKLLFATRKVQNLTNRCENKWNVFTATIEDLQSKLKETRTTSEKAIVERDVNQNRVSTLETDVAALENLCRELRLELEDFQAKEDKLKEREAELSSLSNILSIKERESGEPLLSKSQVKTLFDKINGIEISFAESEVGNLEPHISAHVKKLFYIIDSVTNLQRQLNLLSHNNEELQMTLAKQNLEIEQLKEKVEKQSRNKDYSERTDEFSELKLGLENIILKLGGNDVIGDQNPVSLKGLLPILEKLAVALTLDSENSKFKAQELGAKLLGSQKVVDDLSTKVKLLEDSLQGRTAPLAEMVQERSIFEAPSLPTGSEISEIEDAGPTVQHAITPAPLAANVRTMRKGSADHLALNIDLESDRLINNDETDDKGHVFKSLNTSGIIPRQGKLLADRIDGIWVSGGRVLMSRPRARLGLITYWLLVHIWLLGTIL